MNLFMTRLTGKMMSTDKFEAYVRQMRADIVRYHTIEQSAELQEYYSLEKIVGSKEFQSKKQLYTTTRYKDTAEYKKVEEYKQAMKDKEVKRYLKAKADEQAELATIPRVQAYLMLKAEVEHPDFESRRAFWENKKRWATTEMSIQEARFEKLKNSDDMKFYFTQDVNRIKQIESFEETFKETFKEVSLEASAFKAGYHYANPNMKAVHSYIDELTANNGGKNVVLKDGELTIETRSENVTAPAWDPEKGFVMRDYAYTADVINTADSFRQAEGLFMAKVQCNGIEDHAIVLCNDKRLPIIEMYHFNGRRVCVGVRTEKGVKTEELSGIMPNRYYIYSILWTKDEISWMVNNHTLFSIKNNGLIGNEPMYFQAQSFFSANKRFRTTGNLKIDWVRCFRKKD